METVSIERQVEGDIGKFFLDTLGWLHVDGMDDTCEEFVKFYYGVRRLINPNTHFTSLDNLGPSLLYIFLKTRGVLFVLPDLLRLYHIKYYEFTTDLKKVIKIYPEFNTRNRTSIIKEYIKTILKSYLVEERIVSLAFVLFDHFYPLVQYTKEELVAAVTCALTAISFDLHEVSMRSICDRAGIRQSSLYRSIMCNIFPYLGIPSNFKLKSSFELVKGKIRKKTSLAEIEARTIEEEVVDLWASGLSVKKIVELVEIPKNTVIGMLKSSLGDYRNYIIRYSVTQQEIDVACRLRKKGLSYKEIVPRLHRQQKIIKKIVEENLEDHAKYKYIPARDRIKRATLTVPMESVNPEPVVQFYCDLLTKIKKIRRKKIPLNKLAYLLLQNEARVKKNITEIGLYMSKVDLYRIEKTVLGMMIALSFPQIPQYQVANLIGVSATAIRKNLALKKFHGETIANCVNLAVKKQINLESILDYLKIVVSSTEIPQVEPKTLGIVVDKVEQVKANVLAITRLLRERNLFRDEALILATVIFVACPSVKKRTVKQIVRGAVGRRVKLDQIEALQKEFVAYEPVIQKELPLGEQLGELLEERKTDILCAKCGGFVSLQIYSNNKKTFACNRC